MNKPRPAVVKAQPLYQKKFHLEEGDKTFALAILDYHNARMAEHNAWRLDNERHIPEPKAKQQLADLENIIEALSRLNDATVAFESTLCDCKE